MGELHTGFKKTLHDRGFLSGHVGKKNLVDWSSDLFDVLPFKLVTMVTKDAWNKVVGRMSPRSSTLLTRFRLNTRDNFDAVYAAFETFEKCHTDAHFLKAVSWWENIANDARVAIKEGYIRIPRETDSAKGKSAFGNPCIS